MDGTYSGGRVGGTLLTTIADALRGLSPAAVPAGPRTVWSTGAAAVALFCITLFLLMAAGGCAGRTSVIPNSDPALRKTKNEFAADAMARQPYHADAPRAGKINGRASFDYADDTLQIVNFSADDWADVEIWVNQQYVVFVPRVAGNTMTAKTIDFTMLYNRLGHPFPSENKDEDSMVRKVEVYMGGKMYDLTAKPAE